MLERESDEELLARTASGDQRAFRPLIARHMGRAIRLAQAIVGNAADADDVAQDAFMRVWSQAASFDPSLARFTTWLHRIVVNLAIDRTRRPRRRADRAGRPTSRASSRARSPLSSPTRSST